MDELRLANHVGYAKLNNYGAFLNATGYGDVRFDAASIDQVRSYAVRNVTRGVSNYVTLSPTVDLPGLGPVACDIPIFTGGDEYSPITQTGGLRGPTCASLQALAGKGSMMGFFDDVSSALGGIAKGAAGVISTIGSIAKPVVETISTIGQIINPNTGSMMAMPIQGPAWPPDIARAVQMGLPAPAMSMTPNYFDTLLQQCGSYTGPCVDDFNRRLIAFSNAVNNPMAMNMNTGAPMLTQAGLGGSLTTLLNNPTVRQIAVGLGIPLAIEGAVDLGSALLSGGGMARTSGPFLMNWPAGTPYPRSITLRAPDKAEKRFRSRGASLLDSGDVTSVRRVTKAAARAKRGRRRTYARPMLIAGGHSVCGKCLTSPCHCSG